MVAAPNSTQLNSKNVCCTSGTIAAVTKVHCLYDVSCCLVIDGERLQGSLSWTDIRSS